MAFYPDEDEIYKCTTHPTKRRRSGICPLCLKQRLSLLCPDCANTRPCACSNTTTTSSSSSASSSFSLQFSDTGRISTLIDGEPSFRRSRSTAFPFFRSARFSNVENGGGFDGGDGKKSKGFWAVVWWGKKGRREKGEPEMRRSRSVACATVSGGGGDGKKGKGWYFPSPMKVFRNSYSKTPKFVHERSPLHRG